MRAKGFEPGSPYDPTLSFSTREPSRVFCCLDPTIGISGRTPIVAIYLAELRCGMGHIVCALAYEGELETPESAECALWSVASDLCPPCCEICGSAQFGCEHHLTELTTVAEASPLLLQLSDQLAEGSRRMTRAGYRFFPPEVKTHNHPFTS